MSGKGDSGPSVPPRGRIYDQARELQALAAIAVDCAGQGRAANLARAVATLDKMRAVLGPGQDVA